MVRRQPIPDHQQLAGNAGEQVLEEAHNRWSGERLLLNIQVQLAGLGDGGDRRQVVAGELNPQYWRLAARRVRPDAARQQIEAGFIHPDDYPAGRRSVFLSIGQRSVVQRSMAASSRWVARVIGFWTLRPSCLVSLQMWPR